MRKRIISLLLALTMLIGMVPMFAVTADAATTHNPYHKDGALCYMLPYAYNAMQWSSADYYIAHYNIKHVYNYQNLKNSFDKGIPQTLANALDNTANSTLTVVNEIFSFDGEFTEQDLYDYLLTSMLIGHAVSEAQGVEVKDANKIKDILNMTVDGIEVSNGVVFSGKLIDLLRRFDFSDAATATKTLESINKKSTNVYKKLTEKLPNGSFGSFFTVLSCVLQTVEEINEAYKLCAAYEIIYEQLGDDAGLVLQYMELSTSDPLLKAAISKYERIVNSDSYWNAVVATGLIEGLNTTEEITVNILTTVGRTLLTAQLVAASSVWGAFFIGYTIADLWLGISDYVECINEIVRFSLLDKTMLTTIDSLERICTNNADKQDSVKYCEAYVFAMKMAWRLQTTELEKCQEFFEKGQRKGWFGNYFKDKNNLEQWNATIAYCLNSVANVRPSAFINNALDQYSRDLDLIGTGYRITYNLNGGTWNTAGGNKKYNEPYTIPNEAPTKDGFTFTVWQLGDDSYYSPGYELEASLNPCWCSRELVFTACWTDQDTITYNANGGTGAPNSQKNTEGNTTLSTKIPTRKGYTFLGWDENKSAKTPTYKYEAGKTMVLTKDGDVTLYAIWQKNPVITYNANGGSSVPASHENKGVLSKTWPQWAGHTFVGWSVKSTYQNGDQLYAPGASIDITRDITLYAIWNTDPYVVKYDYNDGSPIAPEDIISVPVTDKTIYTIGDTKKNEENFKGWMYQNPNGEYWWTNGAWDNGKVSVIQPDETIELTGDLVLYAKWDYFVHYHIDGQITHEVVRDGENFVFRDAPVSDTGKKFKEWKVTYGDNTFSYHKAGSKFELYEDITVTPIWTDAVTKPSATVTGLHSYYEQGQTVSVKITANNSGWFQLDAGSNAGFKVSDPAGNKASQSVYVEESSESSGNSLKCYTNGNGYTAKIYIPSNCADGAYPVELIVSNGVYDPNTNSSVEGTETSVVTETIMIQIGDPEEDEEEPSTYFLSYDLNYGSGTVPATQKFKEYDHVVLASESGFERVGYDFEGWCENKNGSGKVYKAGKDYQFGESKLLYAKWEAIEDYGQLDIATQVERYSNVYKPGETVAVFVHPKYSNHFHFSVANCPGFTLTSASGYKNAVQDVWVEKTSPDYNGKDETYTNGGMITVYIHIPSNCPDGEYTYVVRVANGRRTGGGSDGDVIEKSGSFFVRASDKADGITLSKNELTIHLGDERSLDATVEPYKIFNHYNKKTVSWKTSDKSVASIDTKGNGVDIFGGKIGTATVTATVDNVSASCKVTVESCNYSQRDVRDRYLKSEATCDSPAVYYYVCSCGNTGSKTYTVGSATNHRYSDWSVVVQPGENTAGVEQRICSGCGAVEESTIPATGHTHTFSAEWSKDATNHWHVATCEHTNEVSEFGTHVYSDNTDAVCNTCGYERTIEQPDDPGHTVCVFDQEVIKAATLKSPADCDDPAVYYKSCTCGAISTTETFTYGTANGHSPTAWQTGETDHWKVCTVCTEEIVNSRDAHADNEGDNTCDTCGYDMSPAQPDDPEHTVHVYDREVIKAEALKSAADCDDPVVYYKSCECGEVGTVETFTYGTPNGHTPSGWQNNDDEHWKYCLICSDVIVGTKGYHADNADDNRCDVCGYRMGGNGQHYWPSYNFPVLPTMPVQMPFTDVYRSDWFYDDVQNAWENDLIDGVTATSFRPNETLTVAQAIKLAAVLHQLDNMGYVTLFNGYTNWYDTYVDYAVENGIIENKYASYTADQMNAPISRNEFVHIFYGAMSYYSQWNFVADNAVPDVKLGDKYASEIYTFYRAGILTGNDAAGTFAPNSSIKRSEVAAILSRMYDSSVRKYISLG